MFSEGLDTGSVERCQMTAPDFDECMSDSVCAATHCSFFLFTSVVVCSLHCPAADVAAELRGGSNIVQ